MTNEEVIDVINTWIEPMRKTLKGTLAHEFLDAVEELERKEIRYAWHDLRKNPDDLPEDKINVEVKANMLCEWDKKYRMFTIEMSYRRKVMYGKQIGWGVSYPYDFNFETDEVIAWREIETFEVEDDY